jgi:hypothetical protein
MIFDCFTFFNELDILEIRLNEMAPVVDRFVLVEASKTFQGADKPLYFNENKARFAPFLDKIEHVIVDFPEDPSLYRKASSQAWAREYFQRDQIAQGRTDDDVRRFMVDRYGDFVLYRPPFNARTVALWVGPFLALLLALVVLVRTLKRRAAAAPPQEFDAQALAHALERLQPATARAKDAND